MNISRRQFTGSAAAFSMFAAFARAFAEGAANAAVGKPLAKWQPGHFQIHSIYTGVNEAMFLIYPDGTSLLLDCGELGAGGTPALPSRERLGGEWTARYVLRVNPNGKKVDRFLLSHFHNDHAGAKLRHCKPSKIGNFIVSGLGEVVEYGLLDIAKVIDRGWPDFNDPFPVDLKADDSTLENLIGVYEVMKQRGTKFEKFRLQKGSTQFDPLHGKVDGFSVTPICANGRILLPDGTVRDLFANMKPKGQKFSFGENSMSDGAIFQYGKFRFFTAGDFQGRVKMADGSLRHIEDLLGETLAPVAVAKANHHGHHSMTGGLVKALQAQVYFACMWTAKGHMTEDTLARLADRSLYPGDRLLCPGVFTEERRTWRLHNKYAEVPAWFKDIPEAVFEAKHLVFDVPPGGETFKLSFVRAADESMTVESVVDFQTRG